MYGVRQQNSLLEIEKMAALGSTSQCSPVLLSNPFSVGRSVDELGICGVDTVVDNKFCVLPNSIFP